MGYVLLYWRIVKFRTPKWLVLRVRSRMAPPPPGRCRGLVSRAGIIRRMTDTHEPATPAEPAARFDTLPLDPKLLRAVADSGYLTMTPIQAKAIPIVLAGVT